MNESNQSDKINIKGNDKKINYIKQSILTKSQIYIKSPDKLIPDLEKHNISINNFYSFISRSLINKLLEYQNTDNISNLPNDNDFLTLITFISKIRNYNKDSNNILNFNIEITEILNNLFDLFEFIMNNYKEVITLNQILDKLSLIVINLYENYKEEIVNFFITNNNKYNKKLEKMNIILYKKISINYHIRSFLYKLNENVSDDYLKNQSKYFQLLIESIKINYENKNITTKDIIYDILFISSIYINNINEIKNEFKYLFIDVLDNKENSSEISKKIFQILPLLFNVDNELDSVKHMINQEINKDFFNFIINTLHDDNFNYEIFIFCLKDFLLNKKKYLLLLDNTDFYELFIKKLILINNKNVIEIFFTCLYKLCTNKNNNYIPYKEVCGIVDSFIYLKSSNELNNNDQVIKINPEIFKQILQHMEKLIYQNRVLVNEILNKTKFISFYDEFNAENKNKNLEILGSLDSFNIFLSTFGKGKCANKLHKSGSNLDKEEIISINIQKLQFINKNYNTMNKKLIIVLQDLACLLKNKQKKLIDFIGQIINYFYSNDLQMLNYIDHENIDIFYQLIIILSLDDKIDNFLNDFLNLINNTIIIEPNFLIYNYRFDFKKEKDITLYQTKTLFIDEFYNLIFTNLIDGNKDNKIKNEIIKYYEKNYHLNDSNLFISFPFLFLTLCKNFVDKKFSDEIKKVLNVVNSYIKKSNINIKLFSFIQIDEFLLSVLNVFSDNNDICNVILDEILPKILIYCSKSQISNLFSNIFSKFHKTNHSEIIVKIIKCIDKSIDLCNNSIWNYITLCNINNIDNPYLYNIIKSNQINSRNNNLSFFYFLKFNNSYNSEFTLLNINNDLSIIIDHKKSLKIVYKNNPIFSLENIDKIIQNDVYYKLIIDINDGKISISLIKNNRIKLVDNLNIDTQVKEFEFYIGFSNKNNNLIDANNRKKISFFDISYLLLFNGKISDDNNLIDILENNICLTNSNNNTLSNYLINNKDNHKRYDPSDILCEFTFNKIHMINSNKIDFYDKKMEFFNFVNSKEQNYYNRFLSTINYNDHYNITKNSSIYSIYLLSHNDNIKSFLCRNSIIKLDNLHKNYIENILFGNNLIINAIKNYYFIDFLFIFIVENHLNSELFLEIFKLISVIDENLSYFINKFFCYFTILFNDKYSNLLEDISFINKLYKLFEDNKLSKIFYNEFLFDEFIFIKINDNIRKNIINQYINYISNNENGSKFLYETIEHLINILIYFEFENEEDIFDIINLIIKIDNYDNSGNKDLYQLYRFYYDLINNKDQYEKEHNISILSTNDKPEINILESQKITNQMYLLFNNHLKMKEDAVNVQNNDDNQKCVYCQYIKKYIKIYSKLYQLNKSFDKVRIKIIKENYLLHQNIREIYDNKDYFCWYLSNKTGVSFMHNKYKLKINNKSITKDKKDKFKFILDRDYYKKYYEILRKILIYDKILKNEDKFLYSLTENNSYQNCFNCLYIKNGQKINSIFILTDNLIYIINNMIIDNNNNLYINDFIFPNKYWIFDNNNQLVDYINQIKDNKSYLKFKNYKISTKKIFYKDISELYKRSHLHIENGIELFMDNGDSHFIVFHKEKRDDIFLDIINNMQKVYSKKQKDDSLIKNIDVLLQNKESDVFYMKYCPFIDSGNEQNEKLNKEIDSIKEKIDKQIDKKHYSKRLISTSAALKIISEGWSLNKISNFDYIIFLNILSGRSYNDLSQYLILPQIIQNFSDTLDIFNISQYRKLTYPLFANSKEDQEIIEVKYSMKDDLLGKYHTGLFYSTPGYTIYYLIRNEPYSSMGIDLTQHGSFDQTDRLFKDCLQIENNSINEYIPELYYLNELFININNYDFGLNSHKVKVDNVILPKWCDNDPRLFTFLLRNLFELFPINDNIHNWIDMVFGYRQNGDKAIKVYNTYRKACYWFEKDEVKNLDKNNELNNVLSEKNEFGILPKKLFFDKHVQKTTKCYSKLIGFSKNLFLIGQNDNLYFFEVQKTSGKINIFNNKIGEILYLREKEKINYFKGGICSLCSINNYCKNKYYKYHNLENILDFYNSKYTFISKGFQLLGKNNNKFIYYYKTFIQICTINNGKVYQFNIQKYTKNYSISYITTNKKGNILFVSLSNGDIMQFILKKLPINHDDINKNNAKNYIYPLEFSLNYYISIYLPIQIKKVNFQTPKSRINNNDFYILKPTNNYTKVPQNEIQIMKYNESSSLLIAIDKKNIIYLFTINNKKIEILNIVNYINQIDDKNLIRWLIPIEKYDEFLVINLYNMYLFNSNGVPYVHTDIINCNVNPITCCDISYFNDIVIITGHLDGKVCIWKINKSISNKKIQIYFDEFKYCYKKIKLEKDNSELKRTFELVNVIQVNSSLRRIIGIKFIDEYNKILCVDQDNIIYKIRVCINKNSKGNVVMFCDYCHNEDEKIKHCQDHNEYKANLCDNCRQGIKDNIYNLIYILSNKY